MHLNLFGGVSHGPQETAWVLSPEFHIIIAKQSSAHLSSPAGTRSCKKLVVSQPLEHPGPREMEVLILIWNWQSLWVICDMKVSDILFLFFIWYDNKFSVKFEQKMGYIYWAQSTYWMSLQLTENPNIEMNLVFIQILWNFIFGPSIESPGISTVIVHTKAVEIWQQQWKLATNFAIKIDDNLNM